MSNVTEALDAIAAATTKPELDAVYAAHITRLIENGVTRADLEMVASAWQDRSLQLLNEAMEDQP